MNRNDFDLMIKGYFVIIKDCFIYCFVIDFILNNYYLKTVLIVFYIKIKI